MCFNRRKGHTLSASDSHESREYLSAKQRAVTSSESDPIMAEFESKKVGMKLLKEARKLFLPLRITMHSAYKCNMGHDLGSLDVPGTTETDRDSGAILSRRAMDIKDYGKVYYGCKR